LQSINLDGQVKQEEKQGKVKDDLQDEPKKKLFTFTYAEKKTRFITKLFKGHNVDIALRTNNTVEKYLSVERHNKAPYDHCPVYRLICQDCTGSYLG
jgi:hypothetical protein